MFYPLIGEGKENLAVILLAGQGPGMADGNVAMAEGVGVGDRRGKKGEQENSPQHQ